MSPNLNSFVSFSSVLSTFVRLYFCYLTRAIFCLLFDIFLFLLSAFIFATWANLSNLLSALSTFVRFCFCYLTWTFYVRYLCVFVSFYFCHLPWAVFCPLFVRFYFDVWWVIRMAPPTWLSRSDWPRRVGRLNLGGAVPKPESKPWP